LKRHWAPYTKAANLQLLVNSIGDIAGLCRGSRYTWGMIGKRVVYTTINTRQLLEHFFLLLATGE
jgi:hypothetical protein